MRADRLYSEWNNRKSKLDDLRKQHEDQRLAREAKAKAKQAALNQKNAAMVSGTAKSKLFEPPQEKEQRITKIKLKVEKEKGYAFTPVLVTKRSSASKRNLHVIEKEKQSQNTLAFVERGKEFIKRKEDKIKAIQTELEPNFNPVVNPQAR